MRMQACMHTVAQDRHGPFKVGNQPANSVMDAPAPTQGTTIRSFFLKKNFSLEPGACMVSRAYACTDGSTCARGIGNDAQRCAHMRTQLATPPFRATTGVLGYSLIGKIRQSTSVYGGHIDPSQVIFGCSLIGEDAAVYCCPYPWRLTD